MIIGKVLNNNVVFSTNEKGEEIIYMGWGLALQKKAGDTIDSTKTMRRFSREAEEPAYAGSFAMFVVLVIQDIGLQLLRSSRVTWFACKYHLLANHLRIRKSPKKMWGKLSEDWKRKM